MDDGVCNVSCGKLKEHSKRDWFVDGLLLKFEHAEGFAQPAFWKLFSPIRQDLDRLYWCFLNQPWMGAPDEFRTDFGATVSFEGGDTTSVQLWCPSALGQYADHFAEEFIDLWGIEPTTDDPQRLASQYGRSFTKELIHQHARVWLLYFDGTCWEIFARKTHLLEQVQKHLWNKPWIRVFENQTERREEAFAMAGLSEQWKATYGYP